MKKKLIIGLFSLSLTVCASDYYYEYGKKIEVTKLYEQRVVKDKNINYYKTQSGHKIGVTNEIIVQCKSNIDCKDVLKNYSLLNISKLSDKLFLVKISDSENVFGLSNILYNNDNIKMAHPNFIKNKKRR